MAFEFHPSELKRQTFPFAVRKDRTLVIHRHMLPVKRHGSPRVARNRKRPRSIGAARAEDPITTPDPTEPVQQPEWAILALLCGTGRVGGD